MLCTRRSIFCIFAFEGIALEHDNFLCKKKPCFSKGLFYQSFQGTILFNGRLDFQGKPEYVYMKKHIMFKYLEFHQNQIPTSCIQYSLCSIRIVYQYLTYHLSNTLHGTTRQKPCHQSSMDPRKFLATIFYRLVYEFHHVLLRKGLSSGKHRHL